MDKKRVILWAVIVLTLAFIFGQSLLSQEASIKESTAVQKQVVEPIQAADISTSLGSSRRTVNLSAMLKEEKSS